MADSENKKKVSERFFADMMRSSTDFWTSIAKAAHVPRYVSPGGEEKQSRTMESMEKTMKILQSLSSSLTDREIANYTMTGMSILPEVFLKMARAGWDASVHLQGDIAERLSKIGKKTEAFSFDSVDQEMFKAWTEIYEQNFQQFLNIPQLGLTRFYQERYNRFIDKMNLYQTALSEFMFVLYLPVEKSMKVMEEKIEALTQEGNLPKTTKDYYNMWIKILEGHYMNLFQSPEYAKAFSGVVSKLDDFIVAKNALLQDLLQSLPVPTQKEMDELYREYYALKKRVKELEKKLGQR